IVTVHHEYVMYAFGMPRIAIRSVNIQLTQRYYILLLFVCFYLPPKIFTLLGIQCLSFSFISYIIVLIFLSFIVWMFYLVKK
ncbi:hypothetical protein M9Y16_12430, partial [Enterococcus faecium]|nr:hypothetical protein [Enterococcus faecium]